MCLKHGTERWRTKGDVKAMTAKLTCPACGATDLDVCEYDSMMVLRKDTALFSLHCPHCGSAVSSVHAIPAQLREERKFAAIEVGAGMGAGQ